MKLNPDALAVAAATATAFIWTLCSLLVWLLPSITLHTSGYMMHMDLSTLQWDMHATGYIAGLFIWAGGAALTLWVFAHVYNRLH